MIAISAVVGTGVFVSSGEILHGAGPAGLLVALTVVGVIACAVMECLSELIQVFPAPNALVEYVWAFVDPDLAYLVGIAYWYVAPRRCCALSLN